MCDFRHWTATAVSFGELIDLRARDGGRGSDNMMLTVIGVGTCEHADWHHALVRADDASDDPTMQVLVIMVTEGAQPRHDVIVEWTGPIGREVRTVDIRNTQRNPESILLDIEGA